jgi:hypothetical protein
LIHFYKRGSLKVGENVSDHVTILQTGLSARKSLSLTVQLGVTVYR